MSKTKRVVLAGLIGMSAALAQAQTPSDAQIAGIVVAANSVDIDAGKLAASRSHNKEVQAFARQMVTDHGGSNQQAGQLAKKLKLKPEESATSKTLKEGGSANLKKLGGLDGAAFDKAYVDHEVAYHQTVLDAIDQTLIPGAKNAELKDLLQKTRPVIADHLEHAKMIQGQIK